MTCTATGIARSYAVMDRVVVVGSSGSGKTRLAGEIAARLGVAHLEMDSVMHSRGWNSASDAEFQRILDEFTREDRWVVDGNYTSHGTVEVVWPRADTFVWSDPPKRVVMGRVIRRTLSRMITGERLWESGLREPLSNLYKTDPYENIIVWAWTRYDHVREKYETAMTDGSWDHARIVRLQTKPEVDSFLASLT
jgi:adenylate kinase family enzyme